ncbi:hypothetical protein HPB51_018501 [Rhipicephalus microplus]|uniref:Uncharacterized protein n=1 Tax=Rhipicephalus microplus TaxID=6941 RepID=A0A9J6EHW3_RHIMP|nr:hypothetical protein HPB51_018501 [Rhipicephalus microplus]
MPDGDCCGLCSGPISETEDYRRCRRCDRRAHVSCIPSSEEEDNLQDHWELHTSAELSSFAEASPRPSEASSSSSAHCFETSAVAVHPPNYMDDRIAAIQDLMGYARRGMWLIEHGCATWPTMNEWQRRQYARNCILQAELLVFLQLEMSSIRDELASQLVPQPLQRSIAQSESYPEPQVIPATPLPDCPAFRDSDDEEDF